MSKLFQTDDFGHTIFRNFIWKQTKIGLEDPPPLVGDGSKPYPPVVHIKIAGKWTFIPLKMVLIGIDP